MYRNALSIFILGVRFMKKTNIIFIGIFVAFFVSIISSCQFSFNEIINKIIYDEIMSTLHNKIQNDPNIPDPIPAIDVEIIVEEQNKELDRNNADFHIKDTKEGEDLAKSISLEDFKERFIRIEPEKNKDEDDSDDYQLNLEQRIIYRRIIEAFYKNLQEPYMPDIIPASSVAKMVDENNEELNKNNAGFHLKDKNEGQDLKKSISKNDLKARIVPELNSR